MNFKNVSNSELFRTFVEQGSREAISFFFQNQADLFYRVAFKYTKNKADAEDVVQSSFLKIIEKAGQYKGIKTTEEKLLQSWCLSIVIQIALMNSRTESNRRKREGLTATKAKSFYEDENMDKNNDKKIIYQKIESAIIQLPEKYRIPIHLKYTEGFEMETISEILNLNINTLKSHIKRGLEKISAQLKENNVTLSSVSLVELIGAMPIEKAPVAIQNMASNFLESSKSSRLILASTKVKNTSFIVKAIVLAFISSIAAVFIIYYASLFQANKNPITQKKTEVVFRGPNKLLLEDTENTHLRYKNYDNSIKFLIGQIEFSEKTSAAYEINNLPVMISLPIYPHKKITVVESLILPNSDNDTSNGLMYRGYWIKNQLLLKCDVWLPTKNYIISKNNFTNQQIYFYENYILVFVNGACCQINRYDQNLEGANVALLINKYFIQKISSRTIEVVPEEILDAIKNIKNIKQTAFQADGAINGKNLHINY